MAIVVGVIGVTVSIEKEGVDGLRKFMISLWPMKNPKPNDRWLDTATGIWYVWLGDTWEEDAWEGGE